MILSGNSGYRKGIDRYIIKTRLKFFGTVLVIMGFVIIIISLTIGIHPPPEAYNLPYVWSSLLSQLAKGSWIYYFVSGPIMLFVTTGLQVILFGFILKLIARSIRIEK